MSSKTQRREPRIDISLPVTLQLPDDELDYEINNASYRGIFIACPEPLQLRKLVRLETQLDDDPEPLQMLGLIAHTVNPTEARESGKAPGMGIQLFAVGNATRERWRAYVKEQYESDPEIRDEVRALETPRVNVHMRSIEQLQNFAERDLDAGSIFVRTSELSPVQSTVVCEIIHPDTDEVFAIEARVADVKETPRRERGMRVEFLELDEEQREQFGVFMNPATAKAATTQQAAD
jgi:Tfp pilus assembly protein PilZ